MRFFIVFFFNCLLLQAIGQSSVKLCSWNIANFGRSKDAEEISYIAGVIKEYDVVAIVEVVAGTGGPEAVERLKVALNETGSGWDYELSEPTSGTTGKERYAVFWKTAKLKRVGAASLEQVYQQQIDREPFLVGFRVPDGQTFTVAAFHAVPTEKNPAKEIVLLQHIPKAYPQKNIIFCGDFNLSGTAEAFDPLESKGYEAVFTNQKTSLKRDCDDGNCLASVYDNIFYKPAKAGVNNAGVVRFFEDFSDYKKAKGISDHIPVYTEFQFN